MLMTLILVATIGQSPSWHPISNYPEWEGFGRIRSNNVITPQRWRLIADRSVEWIADGDVIPEGYIKVQDRVGTTGDQFGFVNWLSATRAAYGLPGVIWDEGMAQASAANNALQIAYGMGHYGMFGARRQNVAQMAWPALLDAWLASPGHRSALLDPTVQFVGIAVSGWFWTFSAR